MRYYFEAMQQQHHALPPGEGVLTLVEIKYTLSILQVYFLCTSQKKSTLKYTSFVLPEKKYK